MAKIGGVPITYGKIHRAQRTASGFMEHGKPDMKGAAGKEYYGAKGFDGYFKKPPAKVVKGGPALAPKIPGKSSPKFKRPTVKPAPAGGRR